MPGRGGRQGAEVPAKGTEGAARKAMRGELENQSKEPTLRSQR